MSNHEDQPSSRGDEQMEDNRFADGFFDGFTRARQIFWRDFYRKSIEFNKLASDLERSNLPDLSEKFYLMAHLYSGVCDLIAQSHSLYPGAAVFDEDEESSGQEIKLSEWPVKSYNPDDLRGNLYNKNGIYYH
jgi:hypothetical protein